VESSPTLGEDVDPAALVGGVAEEGAVGDRDRAVAVEHRPAKAAAATAAVVAGKAQGWQPSPACL
jgi:hypothetical protein